MLPYCLLSWVEQRAPIYLLCDVCMPKAQLGFRRSDPFELKLLEAQDQCDIRALTKFQLPKCQWSLMTMGQSWGILCGERVFLCGEAIQKYISEKNLT